MKLKLNINNKFYNTNIDGDEYLLDILRKIGFKSVKKVVTQELVVFALFLLKGNQLSLVNS